MVFLKPNSRNFLWGFINANIKIIYIYMKLVLESTGGKGPIIESENKIIRRIAKEIVIGKNIM